MRLGVVVTRHSVWGVPFALLMAVSFAACQPKLPPAAQNDFQQATEHTESVRKRKLAAGNAWETCQGAGDVECSNDGGKTYQPALVVNGVSKCKPPPAAEHYEPQPLPHARVSPSAADLLQLEVQMAVGRELP